MWMVGLYLAEGSSGKRALSFSLHEDEVEYQDKIINYFKSYGYTASKIKAGEKKCINVHVYGTSLAKWFPNWLGKKCYNKKIPNELMKLPGYKTNALIKGIYDGDGVKSENEISDANKFVKQQSRIRDHP